MNTIATLVRERWWRSLPADVKVITPAGGDMQICSFLWVYYGFPTSTYEGTNVEDMRFKSGFEMGQTDESEVDCAVSIPDSGVGMALGYAAKQRDTLPSLHL